jgi:MerR family transcriptional regulator, light-induced transcriptional regulator
LNNFITIRVISDACGVLPQTLRAWEKRYGAFSPTRDQGGQRIYSELDLKRAMAMARLIGKGFTISQIARESFEQLQKLLDKTHESDSSYSSGKKDGHSMEIEKLLQLILNFNFEELVSELNRLRTLKSVKEFIFDLCLPLLRRVGADVAIKKLTVTQEHILSTILRGQLNDLKTHINSFIHGQNSFHHYALATPESNIHELSIILADIVCGINGKKTTFLGASHPAESLAQALCALKCDRLILGTISSAAWEYEKEMIPYLKRIDRHLEYSIEIIIGGGTPLEFPKFKNISKVHYLDSFESLDKKFMQSIL